MVAVQRSACQQDRVDMGLWLILIGANPPQRAVIATLNGIRPLGKVRIQSHTGSMVGKRKSREDLERKTLLKEGSLL
jgi:hypothetical protein